MKLFIEPLDKMVCICILCLFNILYIRLLWLIQYDIEEHGAPFREEKQLSFIQRPKLSKICNLVQLLMCSYDSIAEVGDSSHMTWLESDSSRKFKDLWLAWLNKENDLTWLGLELEGLET